MDPKEVDAKRLAIMAGVNVCVLVIMDSVQSLADKDPVPVLFGLLVSMTILNPT